MKNHNLKSTNKVRIKTVPTVIQSFLLLRQMPTKRGLKVCILLSFYPLICILFFGKDGVNGELFTLKTGINQD